MYLLFHDYLFFSLSVSLFVSKSELDLCLFVFFCWYEQRYSFSFVFSVIVDISLCYNDENIQSKDSGHISSTTSLLPVCNCFV